MHVQIDLINIDKGIAKCNLYTSERCVTIGMSEATYNDLLRDGFFIRDGQSRDSAGVLNTTDTYFKK